MAYTSDVRFEWDDTKDLLNQEKHGVSFVAARRLFESGVEDRFIAIGPIERGLVVVVYTEREEDIIRIIGARWANPRERSLYRSYMDQKT